MFRFNLSLLSAPVYRSVDEDPHNAIDDIVRTAEHKSTSKGFASSPARSARTQISSTCSANNNNTSHSSIEQGFSRTRSSSIRSKLSGLAPAVASSFESFKTKIPEAKKVSMPLPSSPSAVIREASRTSSNIRSKLSGLAPAVASSLEILKTKIPDAAKVSTPLPSSPEVPSSESIGKKSPTFSAMGKSAALVGKTVLKSKTVLKNLRKNAISFDSGTSSKRSRLKTIIRRNRNKVFSTKPPDVSVSVLEGAEGVEITAKTIERKSDGSHDDSASSNGSDCGKEFDIQIPKIIRKTSTFATTSLTSGEDTLNVEIYREDEDVRKLCDLMEKIRNNSYDIESVESDFDCFGPSNSSGDSQDSPVEIVEVDEEAKATTSETSPYQPPDCFDLMVFVNNEHIVLEYAPEEFQTFDSD